MRPCAAALVCALVAACAAPAPPEATSRREASVADLPPMKAFAGPRVEPPARANAAIARDFLDLSFGLESGREVPVFTRFEGPITLRLRGPVGPGLESDLDQLLARLRREAGIKIARTDPDEPANITVESVPRRELARAVPAAACFVVPRTADWDDFRANRRSERIDWATLKVRRQVSIFLPTDVAPQEVRDCLHEELAQALGPLNDMFHLTDSVFNDDNFHTVLTGFDMLILRITYDPELRSGMSRAEVAARLPAILKRLNPAGERVSDSPRAATTRAWTHAIETALGPRGSDARRRTAAFRAAQIAHRAGWNDNRLAYAFFVLGRLSMGSEPDLALAAFLEAATLYAADPATPVHEAHVAMQLAAFTLSAGRPEATISIVDANTDAVVAAENAALHATLLLIKAEALDDLDRPREAAKLRREGLAFARYGFGSDAEVRRRAAEIAALSPRNRNERPS